MPSQLTFQQARKVQNLIESQPPGQSCEDLQQAINNSELGLHLTQGQVRTQAKVVGYRLARRTGGTASSWEKRFNADKWKVISIALLNALESIERYMGEPIMEYPDRILLQCAARRISHDDMVKRLQEYERTNIDPYKEKAKLVAKYSDNKN